MAKKKAKRKKSRPKPQPQKKPDLYYVGVQDPVEVRRNVLEVSRDMVQFLQQHQKLAALRNEKQEAIVHLRSDVEQLKKLVNRMRKVLPKTKLRIKLHEEHEVFLCEKCDQHFTSKKNLSKHLNTHKNKKAGRKIKIVKVKKAPIKEKQVKLAPEIKKPASEIEKLESELTDIETKLGKL